MSSPLSGVRACLHLRSVQLRRRPVVVEQASRKCVDEEGRRRPRKRQRENHRAALSASDCHLSPLTTKSCQLPEVDCRCCSPASLCCSLCADAGCQSASFLSVLDVCVVSTSTWSLRDSRRPITFATWPLHPFPSPVYALYESNPISFYHICDRFQV